MKRRKTNSGNPAKFKVYSDADFELAMMNALETPGTIWNEKYFPDGPPRTIEEVLEARDRHFT